MIADASQAKDSVDTCPGDHILSNKGLEYAGRFYVDDEE